MLELCMVAHPWFTSFELCARRQQQQQRVVLHNVLRTNFDEVAHAEHTQLLTIEQLLLHFDSCAVAVAYCMYS
jgi:hypothetical protein